MLYSITTVIPKMNGGYYMGMGYTLVCGKCGYSRNLFVGCGMMYCQVLQQKTREAKEGMHGPKLKALFEKYPNGCIDAMNNIYYCNECRTVECEPSLDFYKPVNPDEEISDELFGPDMDKYELAEEYIHLCPKCGRPMKQVIRLTESEPVDCPECGGSMETGHRLIWD